MNARSRSLTTALGTADLESGEEEQVGDGLRIGSVAKTCIATVVPQEVAERSVDLVAAVSGGSLPCPIPTPIWP